jgi:hypothetical protein
VAEERSQLLAAGQMWAAPEIYGFRETGVKWSQGLREVAHKGDATVVYYPSAMRSKCLQLPSVSANTAIRMLLKEVQYARLAFEWEDRRVTFDCTTWIALDVFTPRLANQMVRPQSHYLPCRGRRPTMSCNHSPPFLKLCRFSLAFKIKQGISNDTG